LSGCSGHSSSARRCCLVKDVDGIYNSDPATCSTARFDEIISPMLWPCAQKRPEKASLSKKTGIP